MAGCLIAALTYFPIFSGLTHFANPALETALKNSPVVVTADPKTCQFQFNPTGTKTFTSSCDIAKAKLEIGRASCRERVCQYVYISVVAVSLQNTCNIH